MLKYKLDWCSAVLTIHFLFTSYAQSNPAEDKLNEIKLKYNNVTRRARFFFYPPPKYEYTEEILYNGGPTSSEETYDFIIVGSGSAGSVIANRLSEIVGWNVLLLEVGEEATPLTDIPAIAPLFQFTNLNWNYLMEKQDNICLGMVDQKMAWPRGRGLGGTSLINYMIHVRGNRQDYDMWAKMGNPGWSYKDVFRYFIKSEDSKVQHQDQGYRFSGGYLPVEDISYRSESAHAFVRAAQEAGHKYVDYNGKSQMGVSYAQSTTKFGRRFSAEKAFLRPIRRRGNLKIFTKARAVKILIDPKTQTAYGIQYVKDRQYYIARATKEVILSAGAFNSPQLLMLSGVGPKSHLEELGIPVLRDLPVGQKLYDHITFIGLMFTVNETIISEQKSLESIDSFLRYIKYGEGPLTSLGGVEALLYMQTNESKASLTQYKKYPDMELIFLSGSMHTDKGEFYRKTFRITDEVYNAVWKPLEDRPVWSVLPMLIHPKSCGYLKLKSRNPYHWPKFYGNYFTDPGNQDIKTFIAAIREVQRIAKMPSFQRYNSQIVRTPIPGCEHLEFDTDAYWECALRHVTPTLHHQVATCKMGPRNDPESVVDNKLRVYGIKNLRVADTSIIPLPLSAHTNVPAFMIGEKAADLIKEDWKDQGAYATIDVRFETETKPSKQ